MKKLLIAVLLFITAPSFAASPPFIAQNLEKYKGVQKDNMSRLKVNLSVSSKNDHGEINISNFILCSATSCWKAEVNKYVPIVNSSTTRGQLIADVLIPTNEKIKAVFFESTRGKQSIKGSLKFKKAVNIEPEYQGYTLYIVLDKVATANGFVSYFPIAVTALPYNPEISYYLIDPKFKQSIVLDSKTSITFPTGFLKQPQLFFIAEHNIGHKFPRLDIYPYVKGRSKLTIKLAEVCKKNIKADGTQPSVNYYETSSSSTRVIQGTDISDNIARAVGEPTAAACIPYD